MTATEELRRMLDECGVEWEGDDTPCDYPRTVWGEVGGFLHEAIEDSGGLNVTSEALGVTPEQAIAATLGNEESYTRDDVESAFVSGYSLGSLPVGSDPQWDQNEQTVDEHMAELGWVRSELRPICGRKVVHDGS